MKQRPIVYIPMPKMTMDILMLHPFVRAVNQSGGNSTSRLVLCLIFVAGLTIATFGVLLVVRSRLKSCRHRRIVEGSLFCLLVATIGAVGNMVQTGAANALGGTITGILVGGAIGGIVVGSGGFLNQVIETLTTSRLIWFGFALITMGCFIDFVSIFFITLN